MPEEPLVYNRTAEVQLEIDRKYVMLQQSFCKNYEYIFSNDFAEKTVIIIPSLSLDEEMLKTVKGVSHYEERMLCMLMLLRMPRTNIVYVSSVPIDSTIVDYYLHFLPGITGYHARQRLTLLSCYDASRKSLTEKILARPRLIQRIQAHIGNPAMAHIACFNVTELEKELAVNLNVPVFGADPSLLHWGSKSGSRLMFKRAGIPYPAGFENLKDENDIIMALMSLKKDNPLLQRAVVKMEDGFSGEGNAIFNYDTISVNDENFEEKVKNQLRTNLKPVARNVSYELFLEKFKSMHGIVEEFIEGEIKESPSVQIRINPANEISIISTHDQILGGESGQVYLGASFPANSSYSREIASLGGVVAHELMKVGVLGRFGVDFLSVKKDDAWSHYAIEINLRKGGTTHPFLMLQFLTEGIYNFQQGIYTMPNGETRCYFASDNLTHDEYIGLTPHDLIDIAMCNNLLYDSVKQCGVMFNMIGALSQYGKLGVVCIGKNVEDARAYYFKTESVLLAEAKKQPG